MTARLGILSPEGTVTRRFWHPSESVVVETGVHVVEAHPDRIVWVEYGPPEARSTTSSNDATCDAYARRGTGTGMCNRPLDMRGECDRASDHLTEGA